ncbi:hypothetical protein K438DRAFT_2051348 [Mycena galopus ATCC 62051]|nr:hypothetical protein K438DRAFT_2051348 [Mycena galopus ATCC 62051]
MPQLGIESLAPGEPAAVHITRGSRHRTIHIQDRHHGCYFSCHRKHIRLGEIYGEHGISIGLPVDIRLYRRPFQCDLLIRLFRVYTLPARSILVGNCPALRSAPAPRHPTYVLSAHVARRSQFPRLLSSLHVPSRGRTPTALHNAVSGPCHIPGVCCDFMTPPAMPLQHSRGVALKASAGKDIPVQGLRQVQYGLQPQRALV